MQPKQLPSVRGRAQTVVRTRKSVTSSGRRSPDSQRNILCSCKLRGAKSAQSHGAYPETQTLPPKDVVNTAEAQGEILF